MNMAEWTVEEVPSLRGYTVEWAEPGRSFLSRRNVLFESRDLERPFRRIGSLPVPAWKSAASRFRIGQRALRQLFYNVKPLRDGSLFVTYDRSVGVFRQDRYHELGGLVRPCRVLRNAVAGDADGKVYFSEYLPNLERGPMRIYRFVPGEDSVQVVHEFEPGAIRHIHGIYADPHTDALWCLSGDVDGECRLMRSQDGFATVEIVGTGDETWRAVSLMFTETHILFAMDAEFQTNHAFRMDRVSGEREELGELDGPIYYTISRGEDFFFAVTAELCPSQVGRNATLWHLPPGGKLRKLHSIEKDRWPVQLLPGTMHFPGGPGNPDHFHFHCVGLAGADGRVFEVRKV